MKLNMVFVDVHAACARSHVPENTCDNFKASIKRETGPIGIVAYHLKRKLPMIYCW